MQYNAISYKTNDTIGDSETVIWAWYSCLQGLVQFA